MSLYRLMLDFEAPDNTPAGIVGSQIETYFADRDCWRGFAIASLDAMPDGVSPAAVVNEWLSSIDPQALEKVALELLGGPLGGAGSTGEAFVMALRQDAAQLP